MEFTTLEKWRDRATIPNVDGYQVLLLTASGGLRTDVVVKGSDGTHRLARTAIDDVIGWLPNRASAR